MSKRGLAALSLVSLAVCLAVPILRFLGKTSPESYKLIFLGASAGWFVFATLWIRRR